MEFPQITEEKIVIKRLFLIEQAEFMIPQICTLIGPQSSGKSVVAKCLYFFRNYLLELFDLKRSYYLTLRTRSNASKLYMDRITKRNIRYFNQLFPNLESLNKNYSVKWISGNLEIEIFRKTKESEPTIKLSNSLRGIFNDFLYNLMKTSDYNAKKIKNLIKKIENNLEESEFTLTNSEKGFFLSHFVSYTEYAEKIKVSHLLPNALFVPAGRISFYSLYDNLFALNREKVEVEPLMEDFGTYYNRYRRRYSRFMSRRNDSISGDKSWRETFKRILYGEYYVDDDGVDMIKAEWGHTPLANASSGQQETLPLLLSLWGYPNKSKENQILIIEEPEAHIYPTAQKQLIELIAQISVEEKCKILFTTHSPYILSCLNNEILKRQWSRSDVSAFHMDKGNAADIFDDEDSLVNLDKLDSVSEQIGEEYFKELQKQLKKKSK